jgi:hypothetical protein
MTDEEFLDRVRKMRSFLVDDDIRHRYSFLRLNEQVLSLYKDHVNEGPEVDAARPGGEAPGYLDLCESVRERAGYALMYLPAKYPRLIHPCFKVLRSIKNAANLIAGKR